MIRSKNTKSSSVTASRQRVAGTPFSSASELNKAQDERLMIVWRKMEDARHIHNLSKKPEYKFWLDGFRKGLICALGEESENLFRIFVEEDGSIMVHLSKTLLESLELRSKEISYLIKSLSEAFSNSYYSTMGLQPPSSPSSVDESMENLSKPLDQNK